MTHPPLRLGVNIDHVATLRNARGGSHPCPVHAALAACNAGADGITAHLREDRRHIRDADIARLKAEVMLPLNLEMAATEEMLMIALATQPHAVCLVPEKRSELTTEGGLDVVRLEPLLTPYVARLQDTGIRVSLFIDAAVEQVAAAQRIGARVVELHTGDYAETTHHTRAAALWRITEAATEAAACGLEVHAGHGLTAQNVQAIAAIAPIAELNIGHFLIGESIFLGLAAAVAQMKQLMQEARR